MSTVGGSGDDVVRKARDEYRKKESDLIKKHQKEMQKVEESNDKTVNELKSAQDKQVKTLQKDARDTITAKDHKYQQEVENIRNMHRKQLQQAVEESQQSQREGSVSKKLELNTQRQQSDSRLRDLQDENAAQIKKKTEEFQNELSELREKQQESVENNRNKLNLKHKEEISSIVADKEQDKTNAQERYEAYRRSAEDQIDNLKSKNAKAREKASENLLNNVRRERIQHQDSLNAAKEGYDEALEKSRERFDKMNSLRESQSDDFRKGIENHVEERIMPKLRQLEDDKESLKLGQALQRAELKRQSSKEIANVKDQFNRNVEGYEMDRREALAASNERHAQDIRMMADKHSRVFTEAMKRNLAEKNSLQYRSQNALSDIQRDFGGRVEQQKIQADVRVKGIYDAAEEGKARLAENQQNVIDTLKFGHAEELKDLRLKLEADNREVVDNLKSQMQKQEVANTEKTAMMMQKYEKQIATLNDTLNKERREHDDYVRRTVATMQQEHKQQLDAQNSQFAEKAKQMQDRFSAELKSENKRFQEKTEQLVSTIKKG